MRLKSLLPLCGIAGSVGKNMENDEEDVRQTRQEDENISESEVDSRLEHFRFPE